MVLIKYAVVYCVRVKERNTYYISKCEQYYIDRLNDSIAKIRVRISVMADVRAIAAR